MLEQNQGSFTHGETAKPEADRSRWMRGKGGRVLNTSVSENGLGWRTADSWIAWDSDP
jgi:hypothetical protein